MVKMVRFQILPKTAANHPVLKRLSEFGTFDLNDPRNFVELPCEMVYIIPKMFAAHPVLALLTRMRKLDLNARLNVTFLPINRNTAVNLGISHYADPPMESYLNVIQGALDRMQAGPDFAAAQAGDQAAAQRLEAAVQMFQGGADLALMSGKLYMADPRQPR